MKRLMAVLTLLAAPALAQNSTSGNTVKDPGSSGGISAASPNTFTADQTFALGNFACFGTNGGCIGQVAATTPDGSFLATGTLSNAWIIAEKADTGFDFAHAAATNPTLFVHSAAQNTTQWIRLSHDGTNGDIAVGTGSIVFGSATRFNVSSTYAANTGIVLSATDGNIDVSAGIGGMQVIAAFTPDSFTFYTGTTSNSFHMIERADTGSDFNNGPCGTAACAQPLFILHSATANTTNYQGLAYYGSAGKAVKALTEAAATSLVRIPVTTLTGTGGTVTFTVLAANATDAATLSGVFAFTAINVAATETCPTPTLVGTALGAESTVGQTPICTFVCDVTPANAVDLQMNCTTTMVQTTLDAYWRINMTGPGEPLPQ